MTGTSTASTTWGTSRLVGTAPTCPPPSAPVAITASMPQAATFSACLRAPTEAIATTPASRSLPTNSCVGACANEATGTCSATISLTCSAASAASARRFTPNGAPVRSLTFFIALRNSVGLIVAAARMPSPPAAETADVSLGPDTYPIPVATMGQEMPSSSVSLVRINLCPGVPPGAGSRQLPVAEPARVEPAPDQGQLTLRREPGYRDLAGDGQREPGGRGDVAGRHARMDRADPHAVVRRREVKHRQVGHDDPQFVEPGLDRPERGRPVVTDAADHVGPLHEDPARVPGHPVADRVVDRVARGAAHAKQLGLRAGVVADTGDVLVAEPVELRGAHHHVPQPGRQHREHVAVGQPALGHAVLVARRE